MKKEDLTQTFCDIQPPSLFYIHLYELSYRVQGIQEDAAKVYRRRLQYEQRNFPL